MFFWIVSVSCISLKVYAESQLTILEMIDVPKGNVDLYTCPDDARICSEPEFILRNIAVPSFRIGKFEVTMEQWNNGTMEQWNNGTMEQWNNGTMGRLCF
ncbi:TPA: hypothetical protein ACGVBT_004468 [Vibrio vulnificus]